MFDVCIIGSGGHWENQWAYVLSNFKPEKIYLIGDISPQMKMPPIKKIKTAEEIDDHLVVMSPENAYKHSGQVSLPKFSHPSRCTYLFGSDHQHLTETFMGQRKPDDLVYIPTDTKDNMYSFVAGAVTLYDRMTKNGRPNNG